MTSFGDYAEGLGTLRASGGDIGGGSEVLVVEMVLASIAPNAERTDGTISPTIMHRTGTGGGQLPILIMQEAESEVCGKESTETLLERSTPTTSRAAGSEKDWREIVYWVNDELSGSDNPYPVGFSGESNN